jgi:hypothetical protein
VPAGPEGLLSLVNSRVARVEPLGEPPVHRSQQFARLLHLALRAPEACEAHGGAEFPGFGLLLTSDCESALEMGFRVRSTRHWFHERDFASHAMDPGLKPRLFGCCHRRHRFANAVPSFIELADFRVGPGQIC